MASAERNDSEGVAQWGVEDRNLRCERGRDRAYQPTVREERRALPQAQHDQLGVLEQDQRRERQRTRGVFVPAIQRVEVDDEDEEELPLSSPQPMAKIASKEKMQAIDRMCKILNGKLNI